MFLLASLPCRPATPTCHQTSPRRGRWLGLALVALLATGSGRGAAVAAGAPEPEFGKDIELAPFVVDGAPLSISIHARTKGDRRYGERFAEDVVEIVYETLGDSTGRGLVIVGAEGEPHPILLFRQFIALSQAGRLDPSLAETAAELDALLQRTQAKLKGDAAANERAGITFDTFLPALPLPLEGAASPLYQLAWAEGFDAERIAQRLPTLTLADLRREEFTRYDWVFYVPPHAATGPVMKELLKKGMAEAKLGLFKRAAVRSAVFVFKPAVKKAVEGMRKGFLFMTILRAESPYNDGDIEALTRAYVREIMPDLKPGSIGERSRVLAAIEKQKQENAAYALDPFVAPARLGQWEAAAYTACEGDYNKDAKSPRGTRRFHREGDAFYWDHLEQPPRQFFPAGDRLLVNAEGTLTIQFLVDEAGAVTGVEERWVRGRQTLPRQLPAAAK